MNSNEKNKTYDDEGSEEGVVDGDQDVLVVGLDDVDDLFEVGDAKQRIGADFQPNLIRRSRFRSGNNFVLSHKMDYPNESFN